MVSEITNLDDITKSVMIDEFSDQKRVYIAGPYSHGDLATNIRNVLAAAEIVAECGHIPFIPHINFLWSLVHKHPAEFWYKWDLHWMLQCNIVVRLPGHSPGSDREEQLARIYGIPVMTIEEFKEMYGNEITKQ